jgi:hypothetical protein
MELEIGAEGSDGAGAEEAAGDEGGADAAADANQQHVHYDAADCLRGGQFFLVGLGIDKNCPPESIMVLETAVIGKGWPLVMQMHDAGIINIKSGLQFLEEAKDKKKLYVRVMEITVLAVTAEGAALNEQLQQHPEQRLQLLKDVYEGLPDISDISQFESAFARPALSLRSVFYTRGKEGGAAGTMQLEKGGCHVVTPDNRRVRKLVHQFKALLLLLLQKFQGVAANQLPPEVLQLRALLPKPAARTVADERTATQQGVSCLVQGMGAVQM